MGKWNKSDLLQYEMSQRRAFFLFLSVPDSSWRDVRGLRVIYSTFHRLVEFNSVEINAQCTINNNNCAPRGMAIPAPVRSEPKE